MEKRNNSLDLLRIIACIMVIIIHTSTPYIYKYADVQNSFYWISFFYNSFSRVCVPIFVMISGAFLLSQKNLIIRNHYQKTWIKLVIPTIVWSIFYGGYQFILAITSNINIISALKGYIVSVVFGNAFYHIWYMPMIIGIYLCVPFILKLKQRLTLFQFFVFGIIFMIIGIMFEPLLGQIPIVKDIVWFKFIVFIGYFILGNAIFEFSISKKFIWVFIGFGTYILSCMGIYLLSLEQIKMNLVGNLSLFVIIAATSLFLAFNNLKISIKSINVNNLSFYTASIYFVHAFIIDVINRLIEPTFQPIWYIPIQTLTVFICSIYVTKMIHKVLAIRNEKRKFKSIYEV